MATTKETAAEVETELIHSHSKEDAVSVEEKSVGSGSGKESEDGPTYTSTHTLIYNRKGQLRYIPMPTGDPKDPLNLPTWRKVTGVAFLCLFSALAIAAEAVIGALIPVFVFYYANWDPHVLDTLRLERGQTLGPNPLARIATGSPYELWEIYLIASLPVLVVGLSDFVLIPLSVAIGRRSVIIMSGAITLAGGVWAGFTTTLGPHLAARCLQGIGVGTVETLIPLIIQDMVFLHWRNRAVAAIWCSQGLIIVGFGMFSPMIIAATDWWWIYWITAAAGLVAYIGVIIFVPETRYRRTPQELHGDPLEPLPEGKLRPDIDEAKYGPLDNKALYGIITDPKQFWWKEAARTLYATMHSFWFPNMFFMTVFNGAFIAMVLCAGQAGAPILLSYGWRFIHLGFAVAAIVIAAIVVVFFNGVCADRLTDWVTRRFCGGKRHAEVQLINIVFPTVSIVIGCVVFGYAGDNALSLHWIVLLIGIFFIAYGGIALNIVGTVYVVESYPEWAGPVLINISSFRNVIAFACSFKVIDWLRVTGNLTLLSIWAGIIGALGLFGLPMLWFYGRSWRRYCQKYIDKVGPVSL